MSHFLLSPVTNTVVGIYWGFARIGSDPTIYKTACSIGYNPYFGNTVKTIEPHLIANPEDKRRYQSSCGETILGDFYDQSIRLSLVEYLRPELPFEGLEKLVAAIKKGKLHVCCRLFLLFLPLSFSLSCPTLNVIYKIRRYFGCGTSS